MKYSMVFAASAGFASVSAVQTFAVVNRCAFDLYVWSVEGNQAPSQMYTLPANSPHIGYSETFRYAGQYEGVSVKVAPYYMEGGLLPPPSVNVTQLEYTVPPPENNDPSIYYDLSMVNGNSLMGIPFSYSPSNPGAVPQCMAGSCSGSYETCTDGYNQPHDDWNTHACPKEQDIIFTFCNGNAQQPLLVPTGKVTINQFENLNCIDGQSCMRKREAEPEPQPQADDPFAVCVSSAAVNTGADGVPVFAALCEESVTSTTSTTAPAPTTTSTTSSSSSSTPPPAAATPSGLAALQQPAAPVSSSSSSSAAPAATHAAAPAPAAGPPTSPLSQLQLSSLANTGVSCWLSVQSSETCGVSSPSKRSAHVHKHLHNHQAFHRRNRIIKSAS